jgi:multisubunit Na+/H+ antiporter MnhC subunit
MLPEKLSVGERGGIDDRFARRAALLPILIVGPFVILLFCTFPHDDDFCFAAGWRDLGLIEMVRVLYQSFQGRLFSYAIEIVPFSIQYTLGGDLLLIYRAFCAATLGATILLALWTGNALFPAFSRSIRILLGLMLAAVLVAGSPQPEDLFYWAGTIGFYSIPALVALWMLIWLHGQADRSAPLSPLAVFFLAAVGMPIATATEISGPVLVTIVLGSYLHRCLLPKAPRQPLAHALILGAIAIGIAIVVLAPGNAARLRVMGTDQGLALRTLTGLPMAVAHVAQFLVRRLTNPALVAWLVFLVLVVPARDRGRRDMPPATSRALVWLPLGTAMIAIYGSLWIGHVATGRLLEQRSLNHLHFVLVGGLSLTAIAAGAAHGERLWGMIAAHWPSLDRTKLAAAALLLMLATPHFLQAIRILPYVGPLRRLAEERFAQLGDGKVPGAPILDRTLILPAASIANIPWFADPVSADPDAWTNQCVARYVGVRSVEIAPP